MITKSFNPAKYSAFIALLTAGLFLSVPAVLLNGRIAQLTKDISRSQAALNQVLPGLNNETLDQFKQEINKILETQLLPLVYLFDPPQKDIKKDYDPAIYFVDELGKTNQLLKAKAATKQVNYTDLGFKEKLPEEKEARYLLRQLYTLQAVVSKGIDCGINFIAIAPQPLEDLGDLAGIKVAKARLELTAPASAFLEFIIQISQIVPLVCVESLLLKSQDSVFKIEMTLAQTLIEADWKEKGIPFNPLNEKDIFLGQEKFINVLRGDNPLSAPKPQGSAQPAAQANIEQPKQPLRFLYKGKATLQSKEVAIVEDTLNKKTVFLAPGEKIGDFLLKELKGQEIVLKNITDDREITIKREAK